MGLASPRTSTRNEDFAFGFCIVVNESNSSFLPSVHENTTVAGKYDEENDEDDEDEDDENDENEDIHKNNKNKNNKKKKNKNGLWAPTTFGSNHFFYA